MSICLHLAPGRLFMHTVVCSTSTLTAQQYLQHNGSIVIAVLIVVRVCIAVHNNKVYNEVQ